MDIPLVVTVKLDPFSQAYFDKLRKEHFPKHVNFLPAHCTLFHKLPSSGKFIQPKLVAMTRRAPIAMKTGGIKNGGNAVMYMIESPELQLLHKTLQKAFDPWLISRDRQRLKPHITIQNKVSAYKAKLLFEKQLLAYEAIQMTAVGLSTWLYLKGPWQHVEDYHFAPRPI